MHILLLGNIKNMLEENVGKSSNVKVECWSDGKKF